MPHKEQEINPLNSTKAEAHKLLGHEPNESELRAYKSAKENIPPVEVRTLRFILKHNPRFRPRNDDLARQIQTRKEVIELRATIPWSRFEYLLPKLSRKLLNNAWWEMVQAEAKAKKIPQQYIT